MAVLSLQPLPTCSAPLLGNALKEIVPSDWLPRLAGRRGKKYNDMLIYEFQYWNDEV